MTVAPSSRLSSCETGRDLGRGSYSSVWLHEVPVDTDTERLATAIAAGREDTRLGGVLLLLLEGIKDWVRLLQSRARAEVAQGLYTGTSE